MLDMSFAFFLLNIKFFQVLLCYEDDHVIFFSYMMNCILEKHCFSRLFFL